MSASISMSVSTDSAGTSQDVKHIECYDLYSMTKYKPLHEYLDVRRDVFKTYQFGEVLGTGAYSKVRVAYNQKNGVSEACKVFETNYCLGSPQRLQNVIREAETLLSLKHPNILGFRDFYLSENYILLFTEKLDMNLFEYLNKYFDTLTE